QDDEQGDYPCEDWAADEKLRHEDDPFGYSWRCLGSSTACDCGNAVCRTAMRAAPGDATGMLTESVAGPKARRRAVQRCPERLAWKHRGPTHRGPRHCRALRPLPGLPVPV